jgi:pimeloyl-ACP methyl ester carboxylesterase
MPYVTTSAGELFYAERGSGPPVLMLHAALHDHRDFDAVAGPLAEHHRTIAIDWPGHGESSPPPDGVAADGPLFASLLAEITDRLALPPALVIGNSVGGFAASKFAIDHPDRVAGLVLVNSAGFNNLTAFGRFFCRTLGTPAINRRVLPHLVRAYMKPRNDHDREITARVVARARTEAGARLDAALWRSFTEPEYDLRGLADRLTAPTLLVWGTKDPILPTNAGRETHAALPGSTLELLDTGHVVFASDPERFLALVEPFAAAAFEGTVRASPSGS